MKTTLLILVMMLMATTSYNQTSRRSANTNSNAGREHKSVRASSNPSTNQTRRAVTTNRNDKATIDRYSRTNRNRSAMASARSQTHDQFSKRPGVNSRSNNKAVASRKVPNHARTAPANNSVSYRHRTASRSITYNSPRKYYGTRKVYRHGYYNKPVVNARVHYRFRLPAHVDIIWTKDMRYHYSRYYPGFEWHYSYGHRIKSIPAYEATYYLGDVMRVYGRIDEVYYHHETDEYYLYVGNYYPYQVFTVVLPGYIARRYSRHPLFYFDNEHVSITGLITSFNGEPEIVVRGYHQIKRY